MRVWRMRVVRVVAMRRVGMRRVGMRRVGMRRVGMRRMGVVRVVVMRVVRMVRMVRVVRVMRVMRVMRVVWMMRMVGVVWMVGMVGMAAVRHSRAYGNDSHGMITDDCDLAPVRTREIAPIHRWAWVAAPDTAVHAEHTIVAAGLEWSEIGEAGPRAVRHIRAYGNGSHELITDYRDLAPVRAREIAPIHRWAWVAAPDIAVHAVHTIVAAGLEWSEIGGRCPRAQQPGVLTCLRRVRMARWGEWHVLARLRTVWRELGAGGSRNRPLIWLRIQRGDELPRGVHTELCDVGGVGQATNRVDHR